MTDTSARSLYADGANLFARLYWPYAVFSLGLAALDTIPLAIGASPEAVLVLSLPAALLFSVLILLISMIAELGRRPDGPLPFGRFLLRYVGLGLAAALFTLPVLALVPVGLQLLAVALITMVVFARVGTMLADIAAGGEGRLADALERGRTTFADTLRSILIGPATVMITVALLSAPFVTPMDEKGEGGSPLWLVALVDILSNLGSCFATALTAVVLVRAWHQGGGHLPKDR